jgi:flagellin-like hook-associated protein FlgL
VIALNGSDLAQALGLLPPGQQESSLSGQGGSRTVWRGNDYAPREPSDAVDTLLRLRDALSRGDSLSIERLSSRLDQDLDRLNLARGRIGIDAQASSRLQQYASDRNVELQEQLSQAVDADLAATISALQLRETTNEATLRLLGEVSKLSLLNFL